MTRGSMPSLPRVLVLTDRAQVRAGRRLVDVVEAALAGGADGVLVRERELTDDVREELVRDVASLCADAAALLVVAAPAPPGLLASPVGLHQRGADLGRPPAPFVGRSCHGAADVLRAADDGLDYVTLSPVSATASKPGYGPALGITGLRAIVATAHRSRRSLPRLLALGGIGPHDAGRWVTAGADGVAVMGTVMRSDDPRATTRDIVRAVSAALGERGDRGGHG